MDGWQDEFHKLAETDEKRRERGRRLKRLGLAAGAVGIGTLLGRLATTGAFKLMERGGRLPTPAVRSVMDYAGPALGAALAATQFIGGQQVGEYVGGRDD